MIGSPFAEDKKQLMQVSGTFLCLTHNLASVNSTDHVKFWARSRLHDKVRDILATARSTQKRTKGTASKLYGLTNFLEQGIYGRVGYGGLMAVKDRQDESSSILTEEIAACFEVIEAVMRFEPTREFSVLPIQQLRLLAASDAAVETDNPGSGGFHFIFFQPDSSQTRLSFVATNCAELHWADFIWALCVDWWGLMIEHVLHMEFLQWHSKQHDHHLQVLLTHLSDRRDNRWHLWLQWHCVQKNSCSADSATMGFQVPAPKTKPKVMASPPPVPDPKDTQRLLLRRWPLQKLKAKLLYLEKNSVPRLLFLKMQCYKSNVI